MIYSTSALVALGFATVASAHMVITTPVPYGKSTLTNSPLLADGSDFPCKLRSGAFDAEGAENVMPLGSTQSLAFMGSAVHGGGSCQVSITYDEIPSASSTWKVIHSIEGGCPMKNIDGNNGDSASQVDPDTYSYTIPTSLPTGNATLAWTWFNKIGNREMYMNCAPISLTSTSSKREEIVERDSSAYDSLPDMFVANIGNGCGTVDSTDLVFPNPGDSVEQDGLPTSSALSTPTGSCQAVVAGQSGSPTAGASGSAAVTSAAATSAPVVSASLSGGVFATVPTTIATVASVTPASSAPVATSTASSGSSGSGTSGTTGAMTAGTACSPEGTWNCVNGSSFQQCASGTWSVVQQLAAGTSCTTGQSANINMVAGSKKGRSIRFSQDHVRRQMHKAH